MASDPAVPAKDGKRGADERGPLRQKIPVGARSGISHMAFNIQHDGRNVSLPVMGHGGAGVVYRRTYPVGSGCRLRSLGGLTTRTRAAACARAGLGKRLLLPSRREAVTTDRPSCHRVAVHAGAVKAFAQASLPVAYA
jgi:hypothetical protein